MSPKQASSDVRLRGDRQAVVDASGRQDADGTARSVNELDVLRQHVAQPVAVDRVRVPAAHFHDPVVPRGIDGPRDLTRDARISDGSRNSSTYFMPFVIVVPPRRARTRTP